MIPLIDGDIVAYRCAASAESDSEWVATSRVDAQMHVILESCNANAYKCAISGESNFRYDIYPDYKANRKDTVRPKYLLRCKEYLVSSWNSSISENCEADDLLGHWQHVSEHSATSTVICSIDKDLLMIPGHHFNFVKNEFRFVTPVQGLYNFYTQLLTGDVADNVKGIKGIGPKTAAKILDAAKPEEWLQVVRDIYKNDALMLQTGRVLWIQQKENDEWSPKELTDGMESTSSAVETQQESIPEKEQVTTSSTEPTT